MVVLHIIDNLGYGGTQALLSSLWQSPENQRQNITHKVVVLLYRPTVYYQRLQQQGIEVIFLAKNKFQLFKALWLLHKIFRHRNFDVVHLHLRFSVLFGSMFSKIHGFKNLLYTVYEIKAQNRFSFPYIYRWLSRQCKFVFTVFSPSELYNIGVPKNKVIPLQMAVSDQSEGLQSERCKVLLIEKYPVLKGKSIVLCVSRLETERFIFQLTEVLFQVLKQNNDIAVVLVGDGSQRQTIEQDIQRLNLQNRFVLTGTQSNVWHLYMACDVYLNISSNHEIGVSMLEAMLCARAVVGLDIATEDTDEKIFFPSAKSVAQVAEKINYYCINKDEALQIGLYLQTYIRQNYNIQTLVEKHISTYQQVVV